MELDLDLNTKNVLHLMHNEQAIKVTNMLRSIIDLNDEIDEELEKQNLILNNILKLIKDEDIKEGFDITIEHIKNHLIKEEMFELIEKFQ